MALHNVLLCQMREIQFLHKASLISLSRKKWIKTDKGCLPAVVVIFVGSI
jgi:hypothetical protein